jgi:hypothetical protein
MKIFNKAEEPPERQEITRRMWRDEIIGDVVAVVTLAVMLFG